jgi:hypothetical protein
MHRLAQPGRAQLPQLGYSRVCCEARLPYQPCSCLAICALVPLTFNLNPKPTPLCFVCTQGDVVLVSREGGGSSRSSTVAASSPIDSDSAYEGVVLDYSGRWLRVALPSSVAGAVQGAGWRVDL